MNIELLHQMGALAIPDTAEDVHYLTVIGSDQYKLKTTNSSDCKEGQICLVSEGSPGFIQYKIFPSVYKQVAIQGSTWTVEGIPCNTSLLYENNMLLNFKFGVIDRDGQLYIDPLNFRLEITDSSYRVGTSVLTLDTATVTRYELNFKYHLEVSTTVFSQERIRIVGDYTNQPF